MGETNTTDVKAIMDRVLNLKITLHPNQEHYLKVIKDSDTWSKNEHYWWKCDENGNVIKYEELSGDRRVEKEWKFEHDDKHATYCNRVEYDKDRVIGVETIWTQYDSDNRVIWEKHMKDNLKDHYSVTQVWKVYDENGKCTEYNYNPHTMIGRFRAAHPKFFK